MSVKSVSPTLAPSDTIGVAELRQNASKHLRRVKAGASLTITERGKPVARLVPNSTGNEELDELIALGKALPPEDPFYRGFLDLPRLKAPPGVSTAQILDELREDRF